MARPPLTRSRVITAFFIAAVADVIQFPITAGEATGLFAVPAELVDLAVDAIVMAATTFLLGFHWALLPTLLVEVIPGIDLIPTWTASVAYVLWTRKKQPPPPHFSSPPPQLEAGKKE